MPQGQNKTKEKKLATQPNKIHWTKNFRVMHRNRCVCVGDNNF